MLKTIDIHTHLFNLKYLPVAGVLVRYSNGAISKNIAFAVEHFLIENTKSIFDKEEELFSLIPNYNLPVSERLNLNLEKGNVTDFYNLEFDFVKNGLLNKITEHQINQAVAIDGLKEFQIFAVNTGVLKQIDIVDFEILEEESFGLGLEILNKLFNLIDKLITWICDTVDKMKNYFKWFRFMQKSEEDILDYLISKDEDGIDLYVHHLMDVDCYFNAKDCLDEFTSYFKIDEQIANMQYLNNKFKDKIYGFVAFDPSKSNSLDIIKDAIENKGFKGVKFYPPLGYRAYEDERFKDKIYALFDYCILKDIPIFTHCNNQGFEALPRGQGFSGHNSNPMYWQQVLTMDGGKYKMLRLCLAHAGGVEGWFYENKTNIPSDEIKENEINDLPVGIDEKQNSWNNSYAKIVYKLCLQFDNVYCDAAYLDEITKEEQYIIFKKRLVNLFTEEPRFINKIIYGSDWHMLFQEGKNNIYFNAFEKLMNEKEFTDKQRVAFFRENALKYLKQKD